jgi:peptidoglycan/LPS O-acetylase OafA/YrhL
LALRDYNAKEIPMPANLNQPLPKLPNAALLAGYAGLLPQIIAAVLLLSGSEYQWSALAIAYGYATFIFSFLGGIWWGFGVVARKEEADAGPIFMVAVAPSLIAFLTYLPWIWGLDWPGPSLLLIGLCLMLSPLVDRWLQPRCNLPDGWMRLRWHLSLGLGGLTFVLGILALL